MPEHITLSLGQEQSPDDCCRHGRSLKTGDRALSHDWRSELSLGFGVGIRESTFEVLEGERKRKRA